MMTEAEYRIVKLITTIPETVVPESCRLKVVEWLVTQFEEESKKGKFCTCGWAVVDIDEPPGRKSVIDLDPKCPIHKNYQRVEDIDAREEM